MLRSGNTIISAISVMDELLEEFVKSAVDRSAAVAMSSDSFAMVSEALMGLRRELETQIEKTITFAGAEGRGSAASSARQRFQTALAKANNQLALHRFTFTRLAPSERIPAHWPALIPTPSPSRPEPSKLAKGGRPPAEHWDSLWAATAVALYSGDMNPKRQADIEAFMAQWLADNSHEAASSTIRKRARLLWDRLQAGAE